MKIHASKPRVIQDTLRENLSKGSHDDNVRLPLFENRHKLRIESVRLHNGDVEVQSDSLDLCGDNLASPAFWFVTLCDNPGNLKIIVESLQRGQRQTQESP